MERIIEINKINEGIEVLTNMLRRMNEHKMLQLDTHFTLELIKDEEEVQFSNIHDDENLGDRLMSFNITRTYDNIRIKFIDWTEFKEYRILTNTNNNKANELMAYCVDLANNGNLQTMFDSISKIFDEIDK